MEMILKKSPGNMCIDVVRGDEAKLEASSKVVSSSLDCTASISAVEDLPRESQLKEVVFSRTELLV